MRNQLYKRCSLYRIWEMNLFVNMKIQNIENIIHLFHQQLAISEENTMVEGINIKKKLRVYST